jgi:alkylation response protein AidB-like acyl-CoA dehydrogenase
VVHDQVDSVSELLRDSVERFVARSYGIEERTDIARTDPGFSTANWETFAELGWLGVLAPERAGGIEGRVVDAALLAEAFGRGLLLEPFVANVAGAGTLLAAATDPRAASILEEMVAGTRFVVPALRETATGFALDAPGTTYAGGLLNGEKVAVPFAASTDAFVVSARAADGLALVLVERTADGVAIEERVRADGTRDARIVFSDVRASDALSIADPAGALAASADASEAVVCAEAVGVMTRAFDETARHVRDRVQFGRPIATFQSVRHRVVDMFVELELARAAARDAARAVDEGAGDRTARVAAAKIQIIRSGRYIGETAVQLHGAMGTTAEHAAGNALARIIVIAATFGDLTHHLHRYLDATREGNLTLGTG